MPTRKSLRLNGYDYRQNGVYFVTVCAHDHAKLFGTIDNGVMMPNAIGAIVAEEWRRKAELRLCVKLDAVVVMPNHLHGVLAILGADNRANQREAPSDSFKRKSGKLQADSLGAIIGRFKGSVTRRVHNLSTCGDLTVWQRNYYDHIIRSEASLQAIREYIAMNPSRWTEDSYFFEHGSGLLRT